MDKDCWRHGGEDRDCRSHSGGGGIETIEGTLIATLSERGGEESTMAKKGEGEAAGAMVLISLAVA